MQFFHRQLRVVASIAVLTVLTSCGDVDRVSIDTRDRTVQPTRTTTTTTDPAAVRLFTDNLWWSNLAVLIVAHVQAEAVEREVRVRRAFQTVPSPPPSSLVSLQPCDGDLPPCWRVQIESHGDYGAYNPNGCEGRGCFGKYQFSGEWACKLGLPCDIANATPEQQDAAARTLWAGGAGCLNWDACPS